MTKRIALVTGAAKGIGRAISERFIKDEIFVVAVDVDDVSGKKTAEGFGDGNAAFYKCDIRNEKDVTGLFEHVKKTYTKLDILVNNAGIIIDRKIVNMSLLQFESVIDINLKGTWLMCREAAKIMTSQKYGRIINISSRAWLGNPGQSNYSASKAGIIGLTRVLALELGRYNVFVNAVAPGLIDTPLTQALPVDVLQNLINAQPTKTIGKPVDVANTVAFLADENTNFITGQTIYVDGGKSIGSNM